MTHGFENFTPRAKQVLSNANHAAQRFNHAYVGTEHLLLGLCALGDGVASEVLADLGVTLQAVRLEVERVIGHGDGGTMVEGLLPYTPRTKKVLQIAKSEALAMHHNYVGTEHLLLGMLREGEGVAAQVLESLGVRSSGKSSATGTTTMMTTLATSPATAPTVPPTATPRKVRPATTPATSRPGAAAPSQRIPAKRAPLGTTAPRRSTPSDATSPSSPATAPWTPSSAA